MPITENKISTVNHSYKEDIICEIKKEKKNKFIYVGRIIPEKGIKELLDIFSRKLDCLLTIVGDGDLKFLVENYASKYPNIIYVGYIKGLKNILPYYFQNNFFVLNSKKTNAWEELFGIALIEAMATGLIPIVTNHSGPQEIVTNNKTGFLFEEGNIEQKIDYVINDFSQKGYEEMRTRVVLEAKKYHSSVISKKWECILK